MYRIICALVISVLVLGANAIINDCGSKNGKFSSVTVSECDLAANQCVLKRGTNATIEIQFSIDKDVSQVNAVVFGVLSDIPIPFPLKHPNACTDDQSGIKCPLSKTNGPFTYRAVLEVLEKYPKIPVQVKWELRDENNENIVCVKIPAKIQ